MKNMLKTLVLAMAAGFCIGIGGTVSLRQSDPVIGAFLFSIGLLTILIFGFNLFTGMVGYVTKNLSEKKYGYLGTVGLVWLGNFAGAGICALLVRASGLYAGIAEKVKNSTESKLSNTWYSLLILGFFCGILMYIAVDTFKTYTGTRDFLSVVAVFLGVMVFILAGFEHSIADMFYFVLAGNAFRALPALLLITVGNALGGNLIPVILTVKNK